MILGESHYYDEGCDDCGNAVSHRDCTAFTSGVINDYLDENRPRERWMSTFTKFERSLVGYETNQEQSKKIWQSVMFYNFVQVAMGGAREAATSQDYQGAAEPFFEVLRQKMISILRDITDSYETRVNTCEE